MPENMFLVQNMQSQSAEHGKSYGCCTGLVKWSLSTFKGYSPGLHLNCIGARPSEEQ